MKTKSAPAYAYQRQASRSIFLGKIEEIFGLDLRSLALFRVALGLMTIFDVLDRWPDMRVMPSANIIILLFFCCYKIYKLQIC